jgi:hypothetical protein
MRRHALADVVSVLGAPSDDTAATSEMRIGRPHPRDRRTPASMMGGGRDPVGVLAAEMVALSMRDAHEPSDRSVRDGRRSVRLTTRRRVAA